MNLPVDPIVDFRHAFTEGWTLEPSTSQGGAVWVIERLDHALTEADEVDEVDEAVAPRFEDDEAALAFVRAQAEIGSEYHRRALALEGQPRPARVPAMGASPAVGV